MFLIRMVALTLLLTFGSTTALLAEICGDADGSGEQPSVTDGVNVLRAAAELTSACTLARCDVDGDDKISVTDGVNVLRAAADLPATVLCGPDPIIASVRDSQGRFGALTKVPNGLVAPSDAPETVTNVTFAASQNLVSGRVNTLIVSYDVDGTTTPAVDGDGQLGLIVASALSDGTPSPNVFDLAVGPTKGSVTLALTLRPDLSFQQFKLRFANARDSQPIGKIKTLDLVILKDIPSECGNGVLDGDEACDPPDTACIAPSQATGTCSSDCSCSAPVAPTPTPAPNARFVDNGDGTVTDIERGLQWERKTTSFGSGKNPTFPHDVDNPYTWTASVSLPDGTIFTDLLATLNKPQHCFLDHCDWRLPELDELQSIVDLDAPGCRAGGACISPVFGPTAPRQYWTNTETLPTSGSESAWFVSFGGGSVNRASKVNAFYTRVVRTLP